jgi:hypothetical protein
LILAIRCRDPPRGYDPLVRSRPAAKGARHAHNATDVQPQPLVRELRPVWVVSAAARAVAEFMTVALFMDVFCQRISG